MTPLSLVADLSYTGVVLVSVELSALPKPELGCPFTI